MYNSEISTNPLTDAYSVVNKWKDSKEIANNLKGKKPLFLLAIGSTDTAMIPGISSAGKTTEQLTLTPALDAEFLVLIKEKFTRHIPVSPAGIPSPVIISKTMKNLIDLDVKVVDTGAAIKPECEHVGLNMGPGESINSGLSLGPVKTKFLFQKGEKLATSLTDYPYIVLGECIPGGTTTALSLLCALGVDAFDLVNSSSPEGNHFLKNHTVKEALLKNGKVFAAIKKNPLKAVEHFGDPVQAFICGFLHGAKKVDLPVILAGGSQMVAIYHLTKLIFEHSPHDVLVATTSWIANDKNGKIKKLAEITDTPIIASNVNFKDSKHKGLQAYEEGHIKEGVGAGGLMVTANLCRDFSCEEISKSIEDLYSEIYS